MNSFTTAPLILASNSRYRRALLERLQVPFKTASPNIDESPLANETALETALRLAQIKAQSVAKHYPHHLVIGSDQIADLNGQHLGKPGNHANALKQLQMMRGQTVIFHTALCLINPQTQQTQTLNVPTTVRMRTLSDAELDAYLHIEKPYDCAGSAKSEGLGITLTECIQSDDPSALIGLPLIALTHMLRQAGYPLYQITDQTTSND